MDFGGTGRTADGRLPGPPGSGALGDTGLAVVGNLFTSRTLAHSVDFRSVAGAALGGAPVETVGA